MSNPLLFIFILIAIIPANAHSDCNLVFSGSLSEAGSNEPLLGATIEIAEINEGQAVGSNGNFSFASLCKGKYHIRINYLGYSPIDTVLSIQYSTEINFQLQPQSQTIEGVEVQGRRMEQRISQRREEVENLAQIRGKSLAESLTGISGVNTLQTGPTIAKPIIHGLHSNRILILNNGIRQEGQQWGSEHAPEIDPFVAAQLSVVKGAAAVQYGGDAIAGVVLVQPAPLRWQRGFDGEVHLSAGLNGGMGVLAAMLQQGIPTAKGILAWRAQGSLKRAGTFSAPQYLLANTGMAEYNFSTTLGYVQRKHELEVFYSQFNSRVGIFRGSHIGNLTDLYHAIQAETPAYIPNKFTYKIARPAQDIRHQLAKLKYIYNLNLKHKITATAAFQLNARSEYDAHRAFGDTLVSLDKAALALNLKTYSADLVWDYQQAENWNGKLGASLLFQDNTNTGTQVFIPNYYSLTTGIFAIQRYRREHWQAEAGLRYDYKWLGAAMYRQDTIYRPQYHFHNISALLGINISPNDYLKINANLGSAWRAPSPNELFSNGVHHSAASFEIGNEQLKPEKAYNSQLSLDFLLPRRFFFQVAGYANFIRDFIYTQAVLPATLTIRGAFPTFRYQQTNALLAGLDAEMGLTIYKNLTAESQFSMVRGYNLSDQNFLPFMPADKWRNELKYAYNADSGLVSNYFVSMSTTTVFRQNRAASLDDYAPVPNGYTLLGAQMGMTFQTKKMEYEWSLAADNLLNTRYRDYLDRFRYFMDALGRNITLRLRLRFK